MSKETNEICQKRPMKYVKRDLWNMSKETYETCQKRRMKHVKRDVWNTSKETFETRQKKPMKHVKRDLWNMSKEIYEICQKRPMMYMSKETYEIIVSNFYSFDSLFMLNVRIFPVFPFSPLCHVFIYVYRESLSSIQLTRNLSLNIRIFFSPPFVMFLYMYTKSL